VKRGFKPKAFYIKREWWIGKCLREGRERSIGFQGFGCLWAHVFALGLGLFFLVRELLVLVFFKYFLIKIFFIFYMITTILLKSISKNINFIFIPIKNKFKKTLKNKNKHNIKYAQIRKDCALSKFVRGIIFFHFYLFIVEWIAYEVWVEIFGSKF